MLNKFGRKKTSVQKLRIIGKHGPTLKTTKQIEAFD